MEYFTPLSIRSPIFVAKYQIRATALILEGSEYSLYHYNMQYFTPRKFLGACTDKLVLNSGQYALFYILMNFAASGLGYFTNLGHTLLLFILIIQTVILAAFGQKPWKRFLFSLLAPAMYTLLEMREGMSFVLNMGHMFFWFSSILTGVIQALMQVKKTGGVRLVMEFSLTVANVAIFMLVYFFFDTQNGLKDLLDKGSITLAAYETSLGINNFGSAFSTFLSDPTHVFILSGGAMLTLGLGISRVRIFRLSERIKDLFGLYVDQNVRDRILLAGNEEISESTELAILFSDIMGFTSLAEQASPKEVTSMLNEYFAWWDEEVAAHGGTIDKYIGDAVMVVFGLRDTGDSCARAVECAIAMQAKLPALQETLKSRNLPVIKGFGIGINFGKVIAGDLGSPRRRNFTVIGDAVNVASRLESLSRKADSPVLVSGDVLRNLPDTLARKFKPRGRAILKGKAEETEVHSLIIQ